MIVLILRDIIRIFNFEYIKIFEIYLAIQIRFKKGLEYIWSATAVLHDSRVQDGIQYTYIT